ncbi:periplasmic component of amino acid ABC-type transporter/signal transduction system [Beggiatoa alba B18LD]|uniref:Periplasmic component of amino acid ABC-type transporter/signal transduction system n=1 Tax=Beggiatoa alba B18LD TaxID=395493 RepID=I3CIE2_9GAMM|nr:transporter substrate-binding domain-containing protein [Beggiatoa alba]EIJ43385.1 periplasmic component of amino acid ABC-type transporter/signal transduction system [Beggiatoa alba B18LD]
MQRYLGLLLSICCLVLSSAFSQADTLEHIKEKGTLRIAVYKDFPPYSYVDGGQLKGFDVELGRAIAEKLGLSTDYMQIVAGENTDDDLRNAIWKGHYLGGGTADVMLRVPYDATYAEKNDKVSIFAPYAQEEIVLAYDPAKIPTLFNLQILTNHKVGVETDSISSFFLTGIMGGILTKSVTHYLDFMEAVDDLKAGKLSAVMGMRSQVESRLADKMDAFKIEAIPMRGMNSAWQVGLAVTADNSELAKTLTVVMNTLRQEGVLKTLANKYHVTPVEPSEKQAATTNN